MSAAHCDLSRPVADGLHPDWVIRPRTLRVDNSHMPDLALRCLRRPVLIQGAQHATALGAQALASLIPLVVVVAVVAPGNAGGSERVDALLAGSGAVESALTCVGVVILALATLSLAGAVQRIFQRAYGQEPGGITDAPLRSAFLAGLVTFAAIESPLRQALEGVGGVVSRSLLGARAAPCCGSGCHSSSREWRPGGGSSREPCSSGLWVRRSLSSRASTCRSSRSAQSSATA
jgi:hypothetical protein